ncbi:MAG: hypothetical protein L0Y72_28790 [Gemmataceae bacterium]|nr:hypothetical protein [Gemmataceae bacterium]MCI0743046.1 hypothetical protein [Gemmataceae bacterium]
MEPSILILLVLIGFIALLFFIRSDSRKLTERPKPKRRKKPCKYVPSTDDINGHSHGGFKYRGRQFEFTDAKCTWHLEGELTVDANGDGCGLTLVRIPFVGATELGELPGRVWDPDDDELMEYADVFAEGGLEVEERTVGIVGGRIECTRFDPEKCVLCVSFHLFLLQDNDDPEDEIDGLANCRVML